jgi:hypothetical protein
MLLLDRIDSAPLLDEAFTVYFKVWISNLIDNVNENYNDLESFINLNFTPPAFTQAQIIAMTSTLPDGIILYCTDHIPPCYVGKISGTLVQFTTTAFP